MKCFDSERTFKQIFRNELNVFLCLSVAWPRLYKPGRPCCLATGDPGTDAHVVMRWEFMICIFIHYFNLQTSN